MHGGRFVRVGTFYKSMLKDELRRAAVLRRGSAGIDETKTLARAILLGVLHVTRGLEIT